MVMDMWFGCLQVWILENIINHLWIYWLYICFWTKLVLTSVLLNRIDGNICVVVDCDWCCCWLCDGLADTAVRVMWLQSRQSWCLCITHHMMCHACTSHANNTCTYTIVILIYRWSHDFYRLPVVLICSSVLCTDGHVDSVYFTYSSSVVSWDNHLASASSLVFIIHVHKWSPSFGLLPVVIIILVFRTDGHKISLSTHSKIVYSI